MIGGNINKRQDEDIIIEFVGEGTDTGTGITMAEDEINVFNKAAKKKEITNEVIDNVMPSILKAVDSKTDEVKNGVLTEVKEVVIPQIMQAMDDVKSELQELKTNQVKEQGKQEEKGNLTIVDDSNDLIENHDISELQDRYAEQKNKSIEKTVEKMVERQIGKLQENKEDKAERQLKTEAEKPNAFEKLTKVVKKFKRKLTSFLELLRVLIKVLLILVLIGSIFIAIYLLAHPEEIPKALEILKVCVDYIVPRLIKLGEFFKNIYDYIVSKKG